MPTPATLIVLGVILCGVSGMPGLFLRSMPRPSQLLAAALLIAGSLAGLCGALLAISAGASETWTLDWSLPFGPAQIGIDPLTALFLLLIFTVSGCCALYGTGYWPAEKRGLAFFFGLLAAALALLVMARNGVFFLLAWEIMALANYVLLTFESDRPEVCEAGRTYLVATHLGTLALFALFAILRATTGTFRFPAAAALPAATLPAAAMFVTALIGFGLKAGLMPLHVWLPAAHANAPSHVSALMSGVVIKMGIYGLLRTLSFFSQIPLWWGVVILLAGIVSGLAGVIFAIAQHDVKRLLAYHSIENIGIIAMGTGVALIGGSTGNAPLVILGMGGALLHVMNHGIFKSLLFLGAGSLIHATGTREIDRMGGLARSMPATTLFFLTGAIAICGLPPLNGFVSELFIYLGCFTGIREGFSPVTPLLALAIPALAMIGGLALACFVKVFGAAFLGMPRTEAAANGHEAGWPMLAPMGLLAALCLVIGVFPAAAARLLEPAIRPWLAATPGGAEGLAALVPFSALTLLAMVLGAAALLLALGFRRRLRSAATGTTGTWDCGYAAPAASMQYSSSSFAEILVKLFAPLLRPRSHLPALRELFPRGAHFASHVPEVVLELVMIPLFRSADQRFSAVRRLQHGQLHLYILYVFVTLMMLLAWAT
jgi:hydrogenase-4 component B